MKKIFVFAYYSIKDPVFISATLSYLEKAYELNASFEFHLLTFEHVKFPLQEMEISKIRYDLERKNIFWHRSRWRSGVGVTKVILKVFDLIKGIILGVRIVQKQKCSVIYSEGVVGGSIGYFVSTITRKPHIIHSYEPHADSMLDSGVWSNSSWEYKLLKYFEFRIGKRAVLITGTHAYKDQIGVWRKKQDVYVIPSCVDTTHFRNLPDGRKKIRDEQEVQPEEIVLVYLGKFGGMYMEEELFAFFQNCEENTNMRFRYWIFSGDDQEWINSNFKKYSIPPDKTLVKSLERTEIPGYLSAADLGVVAVRPFHSKRYCSPIKTGEYWACGLPIIVPKGVGDDYQIVENEPRLGLSIPNLSSFTLVESIERILDPNLQRMRSLDVFMGDWIKVLNSA